jgi:hypothetical protein
MEVKATETVLEQARLFADTVSEFPTSASEAGITSNPIKINAGGIKPLDRGVNKEGLNLS